MTDTPPLLDFSDDLPLDPPVRRLDPPKLSRWKVVLLGLAGLSVVAGGILHAVEGEPADRPVDIAAPGGNTTAGGAQGFVESDPGSESESESAGRAEDKSPWSQFLLKGGFSLFVGFCVGYALRTFFKVGMLAIGGAFLLLFLLSYVEVIQVDWDMLESYFESLRTRLAEELRGFTEFVQGSLPAAGSAGVGLFAGFKKR